MNVTDWYQAEDAEPRQWYSVQNKADDPKTAAVEIYDDIIPFIGVNAADFRNELKALGDDIETIDLHIHSRGGSVWEAVAIMNTLRQHKARVVTTVDSIAASSAGFIAVGASDELIMSENAELMAHLPWAMAVGSADDMRKAAESLDRTAKNIVSIFASRTGGSEEEWMQILSDETWWSAQEAVDAGIADKVLKTPKRAKAKADAKNSFDLSIFNHAGRSDAPAPRTSQAHNQTPGPVAAAAEATEKKEEAAMATLSESVLQKLGLDADADDSAIEEAIDKLAERPTVQNVIEKAEPTVEDVKNVADKFGLTVVDKEVHDKLVADAAAGAEARAQQLREANDRVINDALAKGKIGPASADKWREELDKSPETVTALLESLPENSLPVSEIGHGVSSENSHEDKDKAEMFAYVTGGIELGKDL